MRYDGVIASNWLRRGVVRARPQRDRGDPVGERWNVTDTTVTPNIISGGIGFFEQGNRSENFQYQAKATNLFGVTS